MNFLKNTGLTIWSVILCAILAWLALWAGNIVNYIMSIPIGWIGILMNDTPQDWIRFVYKCITFGLYYGITFTAAYHLITDNNSTLMCEIPVMTRIVVILVSIFMIFVIDARLDQILPQFGVSTMEFLRTKCACYILEPVDWGAIMFGGERLEPMDYSVFDTAVCVGGATALILNR